MFNAFAFLNGVGINLPINRPPRADDGQSAVLPMGDAAPAAGYLAPVDSITPMMVDRSPLIRDGFTPVTFSDPLGLGPNLAGYYTRASGMQFGQE